MVSGTSSFWSFSNSRTLPGNGPAAPAARETFLSDAPPGAERCGPSERERPPKDAPRSTYANLKSAVKNQRIHCDPLRVLGLNFEESCFPDDLHGVQHDRRDNYLP